VATTRCGAAMAMGRPAAAPARPFPSSIFLDKNRRDIGKSQSTWNRFQDGNARLTQWLRPSTCGVVCDQSCTGSPKVMPV
jgi:hypothetical protein